MPIYGTPAAGNKSYYHYLLSYNAIGTRCWAVPGPISNYGWVGSEMRSVAIRSIGMPVIAGNFHGTLSFPGLPAIASSSPATSAFPGQTNLWLAQLAGTVCEAPSPEVFVPNIITPNGDAYNEYLVVEGVTATDCALTIYSRWGQQVYQVSSYRQDWNAQQLPAGLYYYCLQPQGKPAVRGWVEVVR